MIEARIDGRGALLLPPEQRAPVPAPRPRPRELPLEPGCRCCADATSPRSTRTPSAAARSTRAAARSSRGSSTATRTCRRRLARGGVRGQGHRRPIRGDRARGRRHRVLGARFAAASDEEVLAQARAWPARCSRTARRPSRARAATGSRATASCARSAGAASCASGLPQPTTVDGAVGPRRARPGSPPTLDGRGRGDARRVAAGDATRWTSSSSRSPSQRASRPHGPAAARDGLALRAHVEQLDYPRSVPVALDAGARRSTTSRSMHPDDVAPLAASECAAVLLPSAELLNAEPAAPARGAADAGAICVLGHHANPGTSPVGRSLPIVMSLAARGYGWKRARGVSHHAQRRARALRRHARPARAGQASGSPHLDEAASRTSLPARAQPGLAVIVGGELAGCARTAAIGCARDRRRRPRARGWPALEPHRASVPTASTGWPGRRGRRHARVVRGAGRERSGCASSATRPATCGRCPGERRGGRSARTWTASAAAGASTGRSGWRARSRSPRAARRAVAVLVVRRRGGRPLQHADVREQGAGRARSTCRRARARATTTACRCAKRCAPPASTPTGSPARRPWLERPARVHRDPHRPDDRARPGPASRSAWSAPWPRARGWSSSCAAAPITPGPRRGGAPRRAVGRGPADRRAPRTSPARTSADGDRSRPVTACKIVKPNALTTIAARGAPVDRRARSGRPPRSTAGARRWMRWRRAARRGRRRDRGDGRLAQRPPRVRARGARGAGAGA